MFFVSCFWLVLFWPLWLFWVSARDYFLSDPTATNSWEIIFPTPIEMLWIGGKGFLFAIIGHSPMESFSELILIFKLTKWFDIRVLICQKISHVNLHNFKRIFYKFKISKPCCYLRQVADNCSMSHKPVVFSSLLLLNVPQFVQIYPLNVFLVWVWGR